MTETSKIQQAWGWTGIILGYAIVIFAGWIVYVQVIERKDCMLLPPTVEKTK